MFLEEYLEKECLTQRKFASLIGISTVHMNRIIRGKRAPSLGVAKKIERVTKGEVTTDDYRLDKSYE